MLVARSLLRTDTTRASDAGVTLVEILVVLALIGTVASVVGLGLAPASRGLDAREEAELLAARMRRASEEVLLTGQAAALVWSGREYHFLALVDGAWAPHPVPLLAETKTLSGAIHFQGDALRGGFTVNTAALPQSGERLALLLGRESEDPARAVVVTWDGATATVADSDP